MADDNTTFGHHFIDVSIAQRKTVIKPHTMADNLSGKAVTVVERFVHLFIKQASASVDNTVVNSPTTSYSVDWRNACSAHALSLPLLQLSQVFLRMVTTKSCTRKKYLDQFLFRPAWHRSEEHTSELQS